MGERNAENADLAVEELKRKARRRLVGAIVLALAAAVILPLLLEREPKPLGDDVSVQIPPVDEGKFVNRLTGRGSETKSSAKATTKNETKVDSAAESKPDTAAPAPSAAVAPALPPNAASAAAAPATTASAPGAAASDVAPPKKSVSQAEQRVLSPANKPANKPDAALVAPSKTDSVPVTLAPSPAPAPASAAAAPSPALATVSPPTLAKTEPDTASPTKVEGFAVQIAAFTDDKGANALAGKLKKAGFASTYVEPVQTSRGTLWRVRVGGYSGRAEADAARAKLKADGWNGIVVMAK